MKISRKAVGDRTLVPSQVTYLAPTGLNQERHIEGLPLGTRGGMILQHTFPLDGGYQISLGGGARGGPGGGGILRDGVSLSSNRNGRLAVRPGPRPSSVALRTGR